MTKAIIIRATLAGLVVGVPVLASTVLAASPAEPEIVPATDQAACLSPAAVPDLIEGEPLLAPDVGGVVYTAGGCSAWATCYNGSTVDCSSSSSSGTCSYQDANCPASWGYVECDGVRWWCPICPPEDCSRYNYPGCSYFWNGVRGCCDVKSLDGKICLEACT